MAQSGAKTTFDNEFCNRLLGFQLPSISLPTTSNRIVDLSSFPGRTVIFCYPQTAPPEVIRPPEWDGCTPQACAYRDQYREFQNLSARVFGLSTQSIEYQQEAVQRLHLPYELLSDAEFLFINALGLPTYQFEGTKFVRRLTLIIFDEKIEKIFYPVVPAKLNADEVIKWLLVNPR